FLILLPFHTAYFPERSSHERLRKRYLVSILLERSRFGQGQVRNFIQYCTVHLLAHEELLSCRHTPWNWRHTAKHNARLLDGLVVLQFNGGGLGSDRKIKRVAFLELQIMRMGSKCRSRPRDMRDDVLIVQDILAPDTSLRRQSKKLFQRDYAFALRACDRNACTQSDEHRRKVGWMNNERWTTTDDGVILILSRVGVTFRAALLQTDDFFQPEIPATRPL